MKNPYPANSCRPEKCHLLITPITLFEWASDCCDYGSKQYEPLSDWPKGAINMNPDQTAPKGAINMNSDQTAP